MWIRTNKKQVFQKYFPAFFLSRKKIKKRLRAVCIDFTIVSKELKNKVEINFTISAVFIFYFWG